MCSRFERQATPEKLAKRFGLKRGPAAEPRSEVRPTDPALILAAPGEAALLAWGLPAPWDGKPLINARAETLAERQTFRPLLANRCLVPATAYFEWRRDGKHRFKNRIAPDGDDPFAFAGLYTETAFTIVTCSPAPAIAGIHGRMPVILSKDAEAAWLDRAAPFAAVAPLLVPYAEQELTAEEEIPPEAQRDLFA